MDIWVIWDSFGEAVSICFSFHSQILQERFYRRAKIQCHVGCRPLDMWTAGKTETGPGWKQISRSAVEYCHCLDNSSERKVPTEKQRMATLVFLWGLRHLATAPEPPGKSGRVVNFVAERSRTNRFLRVFFDFFSEICIPSHFPPKKVGNAGKNP